MIRGDFQQTVREWVDSFTFDRMAATMVFVLIALMSLLMPAQNDTWWQLRAGQEEWRSKQVLLHDTFSHTAFGHFWPNHEWLTQVSFYALYAAGGMPLLTIVAAAALVAAWLLIWRLTPAPTPIKVFLFVIGVASATSAWSLRPQVLSTVLLAVTMTILRARRYFWMPVVFLVWANVHGAVAIGLLVVMAACVASVFEDRAALTRLTSAAVLSLIATLGTPMALGFWPEILRSLDRIHRLGIQEWAPPTFAAAQTIPFWLALAVFLGLFVARIGKLRADVNALQQGHLTMCICALAVVPLALAASRNVPPFVMLAIPAIAALLPKDSRGITASRTQHPRLNAALAIAAGIFVSATVASAYVAPIGRLGWNPLPHESLAALRGCVGNLYNRYDEGGFLIWFAPEHKVFLDGRQDPYPENLINEQFEVERTGAFEGLFARYDIRCAYLPPSSPVAHRLQEKRWTTRYQDPRIVVLSK